MGHNPYLAGNFGPVDSELTETRLRVTGVIPRELNGRLLRIGPNPIDPDPASHHWFLGNGMVHGLRLSDGEALWYKSRYVRDDKVVAAHHWPPVPGPTSELNLGDGVANTNIISHAGRLWAIVEAGNLPVELDQDLETISRSNFDGTLPGGLSAHPHLDPDTGELHAAVYSPLWNYIQYVVVGTDARVRKTVNVPVPGSPMVHDCMITQNYFIVLDLPVVLDGEASGNLPYRWHPEYGARVGLLPREGEASDVTWHTVDPCYVFHPMNGYEDEQGRVVLDVVRHRAMFATDFQGANEGSTTLDRWIIDPSKGTVEESRLDDHGQEFPRLDERLTGKPYRYGYCVDMHDLTQPGGLVCHDLLTGSREVYDQGAGRHFMEPVFVPRHEHADENDGWLLSYLYDQESNLSDVVILEAANLSAGPVATVHLPRRVPYGFHGNWAAD